MPKYCSQCGKELNEKVNFCPDCGNDINGNTQNNYQYEIYSIPFIHKPVFTV